MLGLDPVSPSLGANCRAPGEYSLLNVVRILRFEAEPFHTLPFTIGPGSVSRRALLPFHHAVVEGVPPDVGALIATGDLQGVVCRADQPPQSLVEALARELKTLQARRMLCATERTIAVIAGDLHAGADESDVSGGWLALAGVCRWVVGVAGNHDLFGNARSLEGSRLALSNRGVHLLDESTVRIEGLTFGGICGAVGPPDQPWSRPEGAFAAAFARLAKMGTDVLISHDGPNAKGTSLPGWPSVRRAVEGAPPTLLIRGHDSWPTPLAALENGTQVLNVEGRVVVLSGVTTR